MVKVHTDERTVVQEQVGGMMVGLARRQKSNGNGQMPGRPYGWLRRKVSAFVARRINRRYETEMMERVIAGAAPPTAFEKIGGDEGLHKAIEEIQPGFFGRIKKRIIEYLVEPYLQKIYAVYSNVGGPPIRETKEWSKRVRKALQSMNPFSYRVGGDTRLRKLICGGNQDNRPSPGQESTGTSESVPEHEEEVYQKDPLEELKEVVKKAKELCGEKKAKDLSEDDLNEIVKKLESEDELERAAAVYLIGRRKAREYVEQVLNAAQDEADIVRGISFLALYKIRDFEAIKGCLGLLRFSNLGDKYSLDWRAIRNTVLKANEVLKRELPDSERRSMIIQIVEEITEEEWFQQEKENAFSQAYKNTVLIAGDLLNEDSTYVKLLDNLPFWSILSEDRFGEYESESHSSYAAGHPFSNTPYGFANPVAFTWNGDRWFDDSLISGFKERAMRMTEITTWTLGESLSEKQKERIEKAAGKPVSEIEDDELRNMIMNPFGPLYDEKTKNKARKAFVKSLGGKKRRKLEKAAGKKLRKMTDEELGRVYFEHTCHRYQAFWDMAPFSDEERKAFADAADSFNDGGAAA